MDKFVGILQEWIWEWEASWRSFGCQNWRRFEAEDYRTCIAGFGQCLLNHFALCLSIESQFLLSSEYLGCLQVLFKDYPQEACGSPLPKFAGWYLFTFVWYCILFVLPTVASCLLLMFQCFQIVGHLGKSRYIVFAMYLDKILIYSFCYVSRHSVYLGV